MTNLSNRTTRLLNDEPTRRDSQISAGNIGYRAAACSACLVIVMLAAIVCQRRGPWDPDELKYAQVVQGMHGGGDPFVPHLWGKVYANKPPLYFWLVWASSNLLGGVGLSALLTPVVLAACGGLWLVGRIGDQWYGERVGSLAVAVLTSLPLYLLLAQIGRMDMVFTLAISAAIHLCYLGYAEARGRATVAAFALMGIAVITKGPWGLLLPVAVTVASLAVTGKLRRIYSRSSLLGLLTFGVVLAAWLLPAVTHEGTHYLRELLGERTIGAAVSGLDHAQPPYFYLLLLPPVTLPWTGFLIVAMRESWRRWRHHRDERELWLLCWITVPVSVMSLVRLKLLIYLLPIMPAIALMLGRYWSARVSGSEPDESLSRQGLVLSILSLLSGAGMIAAAPLLAREELAPHTFVLSGGLLLIFGLLGLWAASAGGVRGAWRVFGVTAAAGPSAAFLLALVVLPPLDASHSWRAVCDELAQVRQPNEAVATFRLFPYIGYHLHQDVPDLRKPERLTEWVQRHGSAWCVVRTQDLDELRRYCVVERLPRPPRPTPEGPCHIARVRPLSTVQAYAPPRE